MQQDLTACCRSSLKYFQSPFHLRFANTCFASNTNAHKTSSGCFRWRWQTTFCHLCHFGVILVIADHFWHCSNGLIFSRCSITCIAFILTMRRQTQEKSTKKTTIWNQHRLCMTDIESKRAYMEW